MFQGDAENGYNFKNLNGALLDENEKWFFFHRKKRTLFVAPVTLQAKGYVCMSGRGTKTVLGVEDEIYTTFFMTFFGKENIFLTFLSALGFSSVRLFVCS